MEGVLKTLAGYYRPYRRGGRGAGSGYGAREAFASCAGRVLHGRRIAGWGKELFVRFGVWLSVGLQFALAADIVRSVVAPTWTDIGQLAAIRTFLNFFLERDIAEFEEGK